MRHGDGGEFGVDGGDGSRLEGVDDAAEDDTVHEALGEIVGREAVWDNVVDDILNQLME